MGAFDRGRGRRPLFGRERRGRGTYGRQIGAIMLRPNERGSMRSQQWKATTMNNNIEVIKSVWRRVERPSAVKLRRIKAKAELEARVTLRYMALLECILTTSGTNNS